MNVKLQIEMYILTRIYKTNVGKRSILFTGVKLWIEIIEFRNDVECSQCVFEINAMLSSGN